MALAVASTSTNYLVSASVSITKPTGTASGDLLVAFIYATATTDNSIVPDQAWTELRNEEDANIGRFVLLWRTAGGSEPASYGFNTTNNGIGGGIARITGATPFITDSSIMETLTASVTATGATITPTAPNSLLLFSVFNPSARTASGYAIVTSNPTWTEQFDYNSQLALASAIRPETTATGAATATLSASARSTVIMVAVAEPFAATGSNALLEVNPEFFINALQPQLLEVSPVFFEPRVRSTDRVWTDTRRGTTIWTDTEL